MFLISHQPMTRVRCQIVSDLFLQMPSNKTKQNVLFFNLLHIRQRSWLVVPIRFFLYFGHYGAFYLLFIHAFPHSMHFWRAYLDYSNQAKLFKTNCDAENTHVNKKWQHPFTFTNSNLEPAVAKVFLKMVWKSQSKLIKLLGFQV